jgi:hypothetical protein
MMTYKSAGEEKRFDFGVDKEDVLIIKTGPVLGLRTSSKRYLEEKRSVDAFEALFEQTNRHSFTASEVCSGESREKYRERGAIHSLEKDEAR